VTLTLTQTVGVDNW